VNLAAGISSTDVAQRQDGVPVYAAFLLCSDRRGITRHFGYEGTMRIREGGRTNALLSNHASLTVSMNSGGQRIHFEQPLSISDAAGGGFDRTWNLNGGSVRLRLLETIPGAETRRNGFRRRLSQYSGRRNERRIFSRIRFLNGRACDLFSAPEKR
jgi:hypothetical protein